MANAKQNDVEGGETSAKLRAHEIVRGQARLGSLCLVPYVTGPGAYLEWHGGARQGS